MDNIITKILLLTNKGYIDSLMGGDQTGWNNDMIEQSPVYSDTADDVATGAMPAVYQIALWLVGIAVVIFILRIVLRAALNMAAPDLVNSWKWLQTRKERSSTFTPGAPWAIDMFKDALFYLAIVACISGVLSIIFWVVLAIGDLLSNSVQ